MGAENIVDLWLKLHADMSATDAATKSLETFKSSLKSVGAAIVDEVEAYRRLIVLDR